MKITLTNDIIRSNEFQNKYLMEGIERFDQHKPGYGEPTNISNKEKLDIWISALDWIINDLNDRNK